MVHLLSLTVLLRLIIADRRCVYIQQKTFAKSHDYIYFHYISKTLSLCGFLCFLIEGIVFKKAMRLYETVEL